MNTKMPSELVGSPSVAPMRLCRKKPYCAAPADGAGQRLLGDHAADVVQRAAGAVAGRRCERRPVGRAVLGVGGRALHLADGQHPGVTCTVKRAGRGAAVGVGRGHRHGVRPGRRRRRSTRDRGAWPCRPTPVGRGERGTGDRAGGRGRADRGDRQVDDRVVGVGGGDRRGSPPCPADGDQRRRRRSARPAGRPGRRRRGVRAEAVEGVGRRSRPTARPGRTRRSGRCRRRSRSAVRRSVLSAVLVSAGAPLGARVDADLADRVDDRPAAPPLRSTIASSPLNRLAPVVWSAWARIAAPAEAWATTNTSPSATVPVSAIVAPRRCCR